MSRKLFEMKDLVDGIDEGVSARSDESELLAGALSVPTAFSSRVKS